MSGECPYCHAIVKESMFDHLQTCPGRKSEPYGEGEVPQYVKEALKRKGSFLANIKVK